jgi:hypothetical protein
LGDEESYVKSGRPTYEESVAQPTQLINLFISWVLLCKDGNNSINMIKMGKFIMDNKSGVANDIK